MDRRNTDLTDFADPSLQKADGARNWIHHPKGIRPRLGPEYLPTEDYSRPEQKPVESLDDVHFLNSRLNLIIRWPNIMQKNRLGMTPRFICLTPDNRYLFALNEETHTIQPFTVNQSDACSPAAGRLTPIPNQIPTGSPVCLVFSPKSSAENSQPGKQNTNSERQAW